MSNEKLFSTGNSELDDILTEVYYSGLEDGYDYAQKEFGLNAAQMRKLEREYGKLSKREAGKIFKARQSAAKKAKKIRSADVKKAVVDSKGNTTYKVNNKDLMDYSVQGADPGTFTRLGAKKVKEPLYVRSGQTREQAITKAQEDASKLNKKGLLLHDSVLGEYRDSAMKKVKGNLNDKVSRILG